MLAVEEIVRFWSAMRIIKLAHTTKAIAAFFGLDFTAPLLPMNPISGSPP